MRLDSFAVLWRANYMVKEEIMAIVCNMRKTQWTMVLR